MSWAKRSCPTPTVKTGICRALRLASSSSGVRSRGAAPAAPHPRSADDEKRKNRRTNRCDSALRSALSGSASCCWTNSVRGWPSLSAIVMLRESSIRMPRKFCCGTAALRTSDGRNRQNTRSATAATRSATSATRSRRDRSEAMPRYVSNAPRAAAATIAMTAIVDRDAANVKSPWWNTNAGYLNRNSNRRLISTSQRLHSIEAGAWRLVGRVNGSLSTSMQQCKDSGESMQQRKDQCEMQNAKLLVATTNRGKLREIQPLLEGLSVELVTLDA